VIEGEPARRLGPADLAPDLVALLLAQRREEVVHRAPGRERDDGADVLLLDVHRPAAGGLAAPERAGERIGRRVAAAEAAEIHGVPRMGVARVATVGQVVGDGVGHRGEIGRGREQRRVVGVVRGAEEHGRRVRRDLRERRAVRAAHLGPQLHVAGLHLVAVHQRRDGDRIRVVRPVRRDEGERLLAFSPYASHQAWWKAQEENGVAQGFAVARASQQTGAIAWKGRRTARSARGWAAGAWLSPTAGGQGGSPATFEGGTNPSIAPDAGKVARATGWLTDRTIRRSTVGPARA
jgi:hypothetical protein